MPVKTSPPRSTPHRGRGLVLLGHLQTAEDDHDSALRQRCSGASQGLLDQDKAGWTQIGGALAAVARLVADTCASSAFCATRPQVDTVTARLSEAIDDQFDRSAWLVVDAAARLAAERT